MSRVPPLTRVPLNDPKQTGGMFLRRRPGTAPVRFHTPPGQATPTRRALDEVLAVGILSVECALGISLWGPQPLAWLWVGSYVEYYSGWVELGLLSAFLGMLASMLVSIAVLKRIDYAWRLVRRAAGHDQQDGALEWIFVVSLTIAVTGYLFWFMVFGGPGPVLTP